MGQTGYLCFNNGEGLSFIFKLFSIIKPHQCMHKREHGANKVPYGVWSINILKISSTKVFFNCNDYDMTLETQKKVGSLIDETFLHFWCVTGVTCNARHISDFKVWVCLVAKLIVYFIYNVLL